MTNCTRVGIRGFGCPKCKKHLCAAHSSKKYPTMARMDCPGCAERYGGLCSGQGDWSARYLDYQAVFEMSERSSMGKDSGLAYGAELR